MSNKLEKEVEKLEKKLRLIEDNQLECVYVVDEEKLKFEYVTPSIENLSGYSANEYINFTVGDRLTPESFLNTIKVLAEEKKKFQQGEKVVRTLELELIHRDGSIYWIETTSRFIKEPGKPLKVVGVIRDINERKQAEKKQNELIQELEEALAEKERLLKENKILMGLLPICSGCKRIRDDEGKWWPLDTYIAKKTGSKITHTICPDCTEVFYSDQ